MGPRLVTMVAPFERGAASGGSFRATVVAERLEERGATIEWRVQPRVPVGRLRQALAAFVGPPVAVLEWTPALPSPETTIACHSFMARGASTWGRSIIDFHNIEQDVLEDLARLRRGLRRAYWSQHGRRLGRFERRVARAADAVVVATERDRTWVRENAGRDAVLVPNLLPAAEAASSRTVRQRRTAATATTPRLLFVGTLDFASNALSLDQFLRGPWAAIREQTSGIGIDIVGRCSAEDARRWSAIEGTRVHGFVEDLDPLLATAAAAVLPLEMSAGSSLRVLKLALAGVPIVGSANAFRGFAGMGRTAEDDEGWAREVDLIVGHPEVAVELADRAAAAAEALHGDPSPWDALWSVVAP